MRLLTLLWSVAVLIAALLAAYITVFAAAHSVRILGVLWALCGAGAVIGFLGAALSYGYWAIRPQPHIQERARHLFLVALAGVAAFVLVSAVAWVATELGAHA